MRRLTLGWLGLAVVGGILSGLPRNSPFGWGYASSHHDFHLLFIFPAYLPMLLSPIVAWSYRDYSLSWKMLEGLKFVAVWYFSHWIPLVCILLLFVLR